MSKVPYNKRSYKEVIGIIENQLKNRQYLDNIKTQYCKDKNIELIRIPYWDFDKNDTFIKHITHIL